MGCGCGDGDACASKNNASTENISIGVPAECGTRRLRVDTQDSHWELEWAGWPCSGCGGNTRWVEVVETDCETESGINGCLLGE